jgi:hypothetical protein
MAIENNINSPRIIKYFLRLDGLVFFGSDFKRKTLSSVELFKEIEFSFDSGIFEYVCSELLDILIIGGNDFFY